jgi:tetratricopeptide (TPR) repeat protein
VKLGFVMIGAAVVLWGSGPDFDRARKLYNLTEFQESIQVLQAIPQKDGSVWELIGKNYYGEGDFKKATESLEKAAATDPSSSEIFLWLGRAYGRRAETSSPITAPGYASKARQNFERSTQLNPNNLDAQSDLFEYYLEAPGFLGGGVEKARATANEMARINPAEGHWALAKLAEKRKEYSSAEDHLRRAIEAAPHQVGRFIDLARLFTKQGRYQEADQSLAKADQIAPDSPKLLFAKADLYIKSKRNLGVARELLKKYLSLSLTPEDPPRSEAEKLLKQVQGS